MHNRSAVATNKSHSRIFPCHLDLQGDMSEYHSPGVKSESRSRTHATSNHMRLQRKEGSDSARCGVAARWRSSIGMLLSELGRSIPFAETPAQRMRKAGPEEAVDRSVVIREWTLDPLIRLRSSHERRAVKRLSAEGEQDAY
ncbi:hypothetical protein NUW54_g12573 [Trametes sanguinea]|uniref:Uncharacterized protein n=1 Tax=Trametes sanguinea TaxID=158606 RepID=A0ACC1MXZ5_9APHY|nr:hypothetical protein NUW54_g12573 [Trametes sanguinea]